MEHISKVRCQSGQETSVGYGSVGRVGGPVVSVDVGEEFIHDQGLLVATTVVVSLFQSAKKVTLFMLQIHLYSPAVDHMTLDVGNRVLVVDS